MLLIIKAMAEIIFSCYDQLIQEFSKPHKSKKKADYLKNLDSISERFPHMPGMKWECYCNG
jgi:FMN-dependent NADH-azoreductase